MNAKRFLIGVLAGGVTLFAWETLSNTVIPWHEATYRTFPDSTAAVQAIRAAAPENGMYIDVRGVVAAVSLGPDLASRESLIGLMLGRQFVLDLIVAALLLGTFTWLPRVPTRQYAGATAAVAFAVAASAFASDWNWYGFGGAWTVVNIVDRTIGYALLGTVLGALINRWSLRARTDEWGGVRTSSSMPVRSTPRSSARV